MQNTKNGLVWFTNNLRTHDNEALFNACKTNNTIIAVYCFDKRQFTEDAFGFKKTEKFRARFLLETVTDLKLQLEKLNIRLFVYNELPEVCIPKLCNEFNISTIYYQNEWTQEEIIVQNNVKKVVTSNIEFNGYYEQFLYHPEDLTFAIEKLPRVFTVFRKEVEKKIPIRNEFETSSMSKDNLVENNTQIPTLEDLGFHNFETHAKSAFPFKGGETEALARLNNYFFETKKLGFYKKTRNGLLGTDYSSKFSSWLANGSLSAKTIYYKVKQFEKDHYKNQSTYWLVFELIWRDFFKYVSMKHGNTIFKLKGILNKSYEWQSHTKFIQQWINGETTEPFVNANMIELKETGWMSNRGRQNVASYFAKTLQLDWRIGAAYFESMLIDYDVHSNYGNWQYVAGVGNDPRDRVFNVKLQAERYDSNGKFQNTWLQKTLF